MITFKDNRNMCHFKDRLVIAGIYCKPLGNYYVEINREWYNNKDREVPLINLKGIFPPEIVSIADKNPKLLKAYIESLCRDRDMSTKPLYLSIFKSNLDKMDELYKTH